MTKQEKERFDSFQKQVNRDPTTRMAFFAGKNIEVESSNNPYDRWRKTDEAENKAICDHLGIAFEKADFALSGESLAQDWVKGLPDL